MLLAALVAALPNCKREIKKQGAHEAAAPASTSAAAASSAAATEPAVYAARPGCDDKIPVYEDGRAVGDVCASDAAKGGLTVLDLGDGYAPSPFDGAPELGDKGRPPYRDTLVALENEAFTDAPEFDRAKDDKYLELYGIFPSFSVLARRLADDERHACHQAVDNDAILAQKTPINPWKERAKQQSDRAFAKTLLAKLEAEKARRGLASIDELKGDKFLGRTYAEYARVGTMVSAIARVQEHLKCERLIGAKSLEGIIDYASAEGIKAFQRKNMIVSWELDPETLGAFAADSRELDYRAVLRSLRERVADAAGLLEDGSARNERALVLGRQLDAIAFRTWKDDPLEDGAPDLVSPATEAAARALGWTGPAETRAFFGAHAHDLATLKVAVKLPPEPAYHGPNMQIRAVIDRGDVNYDFPWTPSGQLKVAPVEHRPTLTIYAKDGDREIALVRWPTTIGGWKPEKVRPRQVQMVYKESPPGDRIWKELVVA
ncbi:MAG TPA: hypothetical protein VHB21_24220, partial [Minicystis sp.]|nr:hypothetical protein [Minicystis sp.]